MIAGKHDILIQQGSSFELSVGITLDDGSDPMDYDFRAQMRAYHSATAVLADFTITKGTDAIILGLTAVETEAIPPTDLEKYVWDLEMYDDTTGFVARVLEGKVTVTPEVTR